MRRTTVVVAVLLATLLVGYTGAPGWAQIAAPCAECTCTGDRNADGAVTVDELLSAVNYALNGCPGEQISVAGTWAWTETQTEIIGGRCSAICEAKTYTVTIGQQGHQLTFLPSADVASGSITGLIDGTVISLAGTVHSPTGQSPPYSAQLAIGLVASADGDKLSGTLSQSSSDVDIVCTGTFWVSATKMP
jgi:hypothetical protein